MKFYCEEAGRALAELKSTPDAEAARRLAEKGPNKLAEGKKVTTLQRFLQQLSDPMIIILLVAAAVSGVTAAYSGESFADVFIILIVVLINAVLGVYQESKAEKAIEALQEMTAATSKVIRGGKQVSLKSEELVPGDVVVLEAGDAVPADGRILESASLKIEEAALTGESVPVNKVVSALGLDDGKDVPLGDRKNMAYMGSTVVYGRGRVLITGTGMDTEMGKIAGALAQAEEGQTPLQKKLAQLSKILSWLVLGICVFIFAFSLIKAGDFHLDVIISTFMVAVSLAVAAIPEGLATVVTIVLSIGVTNMSKRNAVIRRLTAVETLGCAQVICSDKTGTLTQNKMTVVEHIGETLSVASAMALCSDAVLNDEDQAEGEPTECALVNFACSVGAKKRDLEKKAPRIDEAPFDSARKMMSTVHKSGEDFVQYTKGAPDALLSRCTVFEFKPLAAADVERGVRNAVQRLSEGEQVPVCMDEDACAYLAESAGGDLRKALGCLDFAVTAAPVENGEKRITLDMIRQVTRRTAMRYDREGDDHYDIVSAYQKSMRGSDPDAALHYLARLLEAGDLPSACRRLMVCACEDVGLAYPQIIPIVKAAVDAANMVGLPEARLPLADAVILVATSPKSNSAHDAINAAIADVQAGRTGPIPRQLQNKHFDGEDALVKGQNYKYAHSYANHWVQQQYLPDVLKDTKYYTFGDNKTEQAARAYWAKIKGEENV